MGRIAIKSEPPDHKAGSPAALSQAQRDHGFDSANVSSMKNGSLDEATRDKPLPDEPSLSMSRSANGLATATAESCKKHDNVAYMNGHHPVCQERPKQPHVRRIKSFGDLLSPNESARRPGSFRRASQLSYDDAVMPGDASDASGVPSRTRMSQVLQPEASASIAAQGKIVDEEQTRSQKLQKRRSSLGLGRKPSFLTRRSSQDLISQAATEAIPPVPSLPFAHQLSIPTTATTSVDASQLLTPRNVSSATAPAVIETRKRKGSGFSSFFPSIFGGGSRSRGQTVSNNAVAAIPKESSDSAPPSINVSRPATPPLVVVSSVQGSEKISEKPGLIKEEPSTAQAESKRVELAPTKEQDPASINVNVSEQLSAPAKAPARRFSIFPSFFRSSSSSSSTGDKTPASPSKSRSRAQSQSLDLPSTNFPQGLLAESVPASQPRNIPLSHSILPEVGQNIGDITFTSLFDINASPSKKAMNRSRASTRSSIASTIGSQVFLPSKKRSMSLVRRQEGNGGSSPDLSSSPANINDAQDYLAQRRASLSSISSSLPVSSPIDRLPAATEVSARSARLQRSNSASSGGSHSFLASRPTVTRSRSSSTFTSRSLANSSCAMYANYLQQPANPSTLSFEGTTKATSSSSLPVSPAITVTTSAPFFDEAGQAADVNGSGSGRNSPLSTLTDVNTLPSRLSIYRKTSMDSKMEDGLPSPASLLSSLSPTASSPTAKAGSSSSPILQKTLRRRANTASSLSSSSPASSAPVPSGTALSSNNSTQTNPALSASTSSFGTRPSRSYSSSRLSSFLSSSTTFLSSSSPNTSTSWFGSKDPRQSTDSAPIPLRRDSDDPLSARLRSGSSSYLGSPSFSFVGDSWSSSSSIPSSSPYTSTVNLPQPSHSLPDSPVTKGLFASTSPAIQTKSGSDVAQPRSKAPRPASSLSVNVEEDDTPAIYLARLKEAISKRELAVVLASSGDDFHLSALRLYLEEFDFRQDPIDIALRRLLLGMHLPRETQQIDRVMEAFAKRYMECNDGLFTTSDQPYILAFSLIMLHTDAFNRSNKNKMTKPDYVKNTRIDGIMPELLEYLYDNITYTPFIYADDDVDINGQKIVGGIGISGLSSSVPSSSKGKLDVYSLISSRSLSNLSVEVGIPLKNPYSYTGTVAFFDCSALYNAFAQAHVVELSGPNRKLSDPDGPSAGLAPAQESQQMKIAKVGILERKDDLVEGGKRAASRKWKACSVLLTGSQLLLFRDTEVATAILDQIQEKTTSGKHTATLSLPRMSTLKPDGIISLHNAIGLYDFTYNKYPNVFHILQPSGRRVLFHTKDEAELNSWLSIINYAASFRTTGIRMRTTSPTEGPLPVVSASALHHSLPKLPSNRAFAVKASMASSISAKSCYSPEELVSAPSELGVIDGLPAQQHNAYLSETFVFDKNTTSDLLSKDGHSRKSGSRGDIIRAKIVELEDGIKAEQATLASDLRIVRNLAILTPFANPTRQRIQLALQPVSRRIKASRQNIARLVCCREVLCRDLLASEREILREKQASPLPPLSKGLDMESSGSQDSKRDVPAGSPMIRSTSGDELGRLIQSPSLLRRSYTADSRKDDDVSQNAHNNGTFTPPIMSAAVLASSPVRFGHSPVIASATFEAVPEEQEHEQLPLPSPISPAGELFFDAEEKVEPESSQGKI